MTRVVWSDERVAQLRDMVAAGYTMRQMADKLGDGISRSAVAGAMLRLGCKLGRPTGPRTLKPRKPKAEKPRAPLAIALLDLKPMQCRFPLSATAERATAFCGHQTPKDSSWCPMHRKIVFGGWKHDDHPRRDPVPAGRRRGGTVVHFRRVHHQHRHVGAEHD